MYTWLNSFCHWITSNIISITNYKIKEQDWSGNLIDRHLPYMWQTCIWSPISHMVSWALVGEFLSTDPGILALGTARCNLCLKKWRTKKKEKKNSILICWAWVLKSCSIHWRVFNNAHTSACWVVLLTMLLGCVWWLWCSPVIACKFSHTLSCVVAGNCLQCQQCLTAEFSS